MAHNQRGRIRDALRLTGRIHDDDVQPQRPRVPLADFCLCGADALPDEPGLAADAQRVQHEEAVVPHPVQERGLPAAQRERKVAVPHDLGDAPGDEHRRVHGARPDLGVPREEVGDAPDNGVPGEDLHKRREEGRADDAEQRVQDLHAREGLGPLAELAGRGVHVRRAVEVVCQDDAAEHCQPERGRDGIVEDQVAILDWRRGGSPRGLLGVRHFGVCCVAAAAAVVFFVGLRTKRCRTSSVRLLDVVECRVKLSWVRCWSSEHCRRECCEVKERSFLD